MRARCAARGTDYSGFGERSQPFFLKKNAHASSLSGSSARARVSPYPWRPPSSLTSVVVRAPSERLLLLVDHLRLRGQLDGDHRISRRFERDALPPSPPRVAWNRVRPEVALSGLERVEAARKRVEAAVRPDEAQRIVRRALGLPGAEREGEPQPALRKRVRAARRDTMNSIFSLAFISSPK